MQKDIVKEELAEVKETFGDERRSEISYSDGEISIEDLIKNEEVVITISNLGYIKRTPVTEYRVQGRGGRGSRGTKTRDTDYVEHLFTAKTHNYLLLFSEQGRCHWLRVYEIPEAGKNSAGRVLQNIVALPKDDKVKAYIKIEDLKNEEYVQNNYIIFCTRKGVIKKTSVEAFSRPRANGINAITIREGDTLLEAKLTNGENEILMGIRSGRAIRFPEAKVRPMGRSAAGVRGITLDGEDDAVVGMISVDSNDETRTVLVVSEKGYGKRSKLEEYRMTNRGGKGVKTLQVTPKTGYLATIKSVSEEEDLMITNKSGITIRISVTDLRVMGRATQGVKTIRIDDKDAIADIAVLPSADEEAETEVTLDENGNPIEAPTVEGEGTTEGPDNVADTTDKDTDADNASDTEETTED